MEALSKFTQTILKDLLTHNYFANREDQVEIPHNVAFPQGLHCFLGLKQYWDEEIKFKLETRTHSMARHRKSPRSQRYLMIFDPLTPSQGHQFDPRVKIFSVSWSAAHPL